MIAHICAYLPPHLGGAEQQVSTLLERLSKKGLDVEAYASGSNRVLGNVRVNGFKFFEIFNTPIALGLFFKLLKDVSRKNIKILHVHVSQAFFPEIAFLVSRIKGIPLVLHLRGDVPASSFFGRFFLGFYKRVFLRRVFRSADAVIVLNEDYRDFVEKSYSVSRERIFVAPNAFEASSFRGGKRDFKRVLFVGRLSVEKNVDKIIRALKSDLLKGFRLYVVGEGPLRKELEILVREEGLTQRVLFLGRLERKDVFEEYKKAGCVVLPSSVEVFSNVLLEAMAFGCPIVASDIPGTRCVVRDGYNGVLVGRSSDDIAEGIFRVCKDLDFRRRIVKNGRREIKKYSWDFVLKKIEEVYRIVEG